MEVSLFLVLSSKIIIFLIAELAMFARCKIYIYIFLWLIIVLMLHRSCEQRFEGSKGKNEKLEN